MSRTRIDPSAPVLPLLGDDSASTAGPPSLMSIGVLARTYTADAVATLVDCLSPGMPPAVRVKAASVILERGWGAPVQHIEGGERETVKVISGEPLSEDDWLAKYTGAGISGEAMRNAVDRAAEAMANADAITVEKIKTDASRGDGSHPPPLNSTPKTDQEDIPRLNPTQESPTPVKKSSLENQEEKTLYEDDPDVADDDTPRVVPFQIIRRQPPPTPPLHPNGWAAPASFDEALKNYRKSRYTDEEVARMIDDGDI